MEPITINFSVRSSTHRYQQNYVDTVDDDDMLCDKLHNNQDENHLDYIDNACPKQISCISNFCNL